MSQMNRRRHRRSRISSLSRSSLLLLLLCFLLTFPSSSFHTGNLLSTHERVSTTQIFLGIEKLHECQECTETFQSRNALFRHIRDTHSEVPDIEFLSTTVLVRYGYIITEQANDNDADIPINEFVATMINDSFQHCLSEFLQNQECIPTELMSTALTYATAANHRQPSLRQDAEVMGATSEVLSFNFKIGCKGAVITKWQDYAGSGQLYDDMQSWLKTSGQEIQIHSLDALMPRSKKFYAERGCSQRSYRFILPLRWLMCDESGSNRKDIELDEVNDWWKMIIARSESAQPHAHQNRGSLTVMPPDFIKRLKRSLKAVESETIPNRRLRRQKAYAAGGEESVDDLTSTTELDTNGGAFRLSPGRFGQLWRKERKCWSNFCHPSLQGLEASPGHEAVWRTIDRARIVGFLDHNSGADIGDVTQSMHAIIELSADGFVLGQMSRIISSVVAMTNGWLPNNFFDCATRPDVYLPAPSMVPFVRNRMYFYNARYHFHELTAIASTEINGMQPNPVNAGTDKEIKWDMNLRNNLMKETPSLNNEVENEWLFALHDNCKVIRSEMIQISRDISSQSPQSVDVILQEDVLNELRPVPDESYDVVLNQLRDIVSNKQWPATSGARSKVIKASGSSEKMLTTKKGSVGSVFPGVSSGSFTIVNGELLGSDSGIPLPNANGLFPDLVKVVFELEKRIIHQNEAPLPGAEGMQRVLPLTKRPPSTHCAVNRNAQFTPHVDSGRGRGQTMSMIVGLGDYVGGETLVEGSPYGIRYNPLEFNGWKQLHWTAPFTGERFSLVYFTPAMTLADDADHIMDEDEHAIKLAEVHSQLLSSILKPIQFRAGSTDALVIIELLDSDKCAYELKPNAEIQGFTLENHACVLDVGAHIGVFSRLVLSKGCKHIIAYEPEPSNFDLLTKNLDMEDASSQPTIELHSEAVAHGPSQLRKLVRARNQNDGTQNTWRHSLEEYSQYNDVDKTKDLPSESQRNVLERLEVTSTPFFEGALVNGVTLVKLDCEGAEIDILLSDESSRPESWLDVTDLVVEWSMTKERRVTRFHRAVRNLKEAGFTVYYEGLGSWWDTDQGALWPYPNDVVFFAHKSD